VQTRWWSLGPDLLPTDPPEVEDDELFVYVDWFGLWDHGVGALAEQYGDRLVVDATQAFYRPAPRHGWAFGSARKFLGVPDGAWLTGPKPTLHDSDPRAEPRLEHLVGRLERGPEAAWSSFQAFEADLDASIRRISRTSRQLLDSVDHRAIAARRRANFSVLHQLLGPANQLRLDTTTSQVPHSYPFLPQRPLDRRRLQAQRLYVPTFWEAVLSRPGAARFELERELARRLLPLPLDQRYTGDDMERLAEAVLALVGS